MKLIFSIISILAAGYLAMQTQFVQDIGAKLSQGIDNNIASKHTYISDSQADDQQKTQGSADKRNQNSEALAQQVKILQTQNTQLVEKVSSLENKLDSLLGRFIDERTDKPIAMTEQASTLAQVPIKMAAPTQLDLAPLDSKFREVSNLSHANSVSNSASPIVPSIKISKQSEPEKRVQQQAILRELSQRMELTALSSLTH